MILKILERIEYGLNYLARIMAFISALAVASITCIICLSVIMRRLANSPLFYAEELVGLLLAVTLFFALPLVTMRGNHIRVTLLESLFEQRGKVYLGYIGGMVGLIFFGWLIWESVEWMKFAIRLSLKTEATSIPLVPWMAIVPLSLIITAFGIIIQLCIAFFRINSDTSGLQPGSQVSLRHSQKTSD